MGVNDRQVGKDRLGIHDDSSDIISLPSKAQKGMKADTAEPFFKWGGWPKVKACFGFDFLRFRAGLG